LKKIAEGTPEAKGEKREKNQKSEAVLKNGDFWTMGEVG